MHEERLWNKPSQSPTVKDYFISVQDISSAAFTCTEQAAGDGGSVTEGAAVLWSTRMLNCWQESSTSASKC